MFLFGFAKSDGATVERGEMSALARAGMYWLGADEDRIEDALLDERLTEVDCDGEKED